MNTLLPLLVAALSFQSPLMAEYRNLWESSDKSVESAEILSTMIKEDFKAMKKTTHKGLSQLLSIDWVESYDVPPLSSLVTHSKPTR